MDHPAHAKAERERQREAALQFGRSLRQWRRRQDWAQDTPSEWGKAIGSLHVYASQWSQLETGAMKAPSPHLFVCLGHQNQRIASGDLGVIRDRKLKDRVVAAKPIEDADGPWGAVEFFAAYIGLRPFPEDITPVPPSISDEAAAEWSATLRDWFQRTAEAAHLDPLEAMVALMHCVDAEQSDRQLFQRVLLGFDDYRAVALLDAWEREASGARDWIQSWQQTMGLKADGPVEPWEA